MLWCRLESIESAHLHCLGITGIMRVSPNLAPCSLIPAVAPLHGV
jgi:hypothetical protein